MKNIINSIYTKIYEETEVTEVENSDLDDQLYEIMEPLQEREDYEILSDLLFQASSCGQADGFTKGFKFAFSLIAECYV